MGPGDLDTFFHGRPDPLNRDRDRPLDCSGLRGLRSPARGLQLINVAS
jgi:hypothetical protein